MYFYALITPVLLFAAVLIGHLLALKKSDTRRFAQAREISAVMAQIRDKNFSLTPEEYQRLRRLLDQSLSDSAEFCGQRE